MRRSFVSFIFGLVLTITACTHPSQHIQKNCNYYLKQAALIGKNNPAIYKSNKKIRHWYIDQALSIQKKQLQWTKEGLSPKQQAKKAFDIRHRARLIARNRMISKEQVNLLHKRDQCVYGNPNGPTFQWEVNHAKNLGYTGNAVYLHIINSAKKTNRSVDHRFHMSASKK